MAKIQKGQVTLINTRTVEIYHIESQEGAPLLTRKEAQSIAKSIRKGKGYPWVLIGDPSPLGSGAYLVEVSGYPNIP